MKNYLVLFALILIQGCSSGGGGSEIANSAPIASNVTITDINGGDAMVGDSLKGNYIYSDEDNDAEGLSRYSWLRNGAAIGGETASTYTLVPADSGQSITFKVTPVAVTGTTVGNAVVSTPIVVFNDSSVPTNTGIISHKNLAILASNPQPVVYDHGSGTFTSTTVTITVMIGDRDNQLLTDAHTIFFHTEWGLIEPSCVTNNGQCSVTWQTTSFGSIPADYLNTITAYAVGEESFTDTNANSLFDDADSIFNDLEEPYIDVNNDGVFNAGDTIIDVVNGNDLTGVNGAHDIGDTFLNSPACTHSSLCSAAVVSNGTIWSSLVLKLDGPITIGTQVGQQSPDFSLFDTLGNSRGLYAELATPKDGVVLYFMMWSPIDDSHVSHMRSNIIPNFPDVSFFLVDYVSGSVTVSRDAQLASGYTDIDTLVDVSQDVFNLYNASMGTTVVIDNAGIVRMKEDYKDGVILTDVLNNL